MSSLGGAAAMVMQFPAIGGSPAAMDGWGSRRGIPSIDLGREIEVGGARKGSSTVQSWRCRSWPMLVREGGGGGAAAWGVKEEGAAGAAGGGKWRAARAARPPWEKGEGELWELLQEGAVLCSTQGRGRAPVLRGKKLAAGAELALAVLHCRGNAPWEMEEEGAGQRDRCQGGEQGDAQASCRGGRRGCAAGEGCAMGRRELLQGSARWTKGLGKEWRRGSASMSQRRDEGGTRRGPWQPLQTGKKRSCAMLQRRRREGGLRGRATGACSSWRTEARAEELTGDEEELLMREERRGDGDRSREAGVAWSAAPGIGSHLAAMRLHGGHAARMGEENGRGKMMETGFPISDRF